MHLFTVEGVCVLATVSDAKARHRGLVRGRVQIPPNFLNAGIYKVSVMIVKDRSFSLFDYPDSLTVEVHEVERTGNWFGKWPGVVRPQFNWTTEDVKEEAS